MQTLSPGARFPDLEIPTLAEGTLRIPRALEGRPAILVFYRGHF